jgi:hypothetical protein
LFRRQGTHGGGLDHAVATPLAKPAGGRDGRQGFVNYLKEGWHFSLPGAGGPAYDFPIKPPRHS